MSTPEIPKKVPQFSALKLAPLPAKEPCCAADCSSVQAETVQPVQGQRYTGSMPPFAAQLPDEALAAVLNHILDSFNAGTLPDGHQAYTAAELAEARADKLAPHEVRKLRDGAMRKGSGS